MYDIEISVTDEKELTELNAKIREALKPIKGIIDSEEIDSDITDDEDEEVDQ